MYGRGGNFNFRGHKIISNKMLGFFFFFLTLVYKFKKKKTRQNCICSLGLL